MTDAASDAAPRTNAAREAAQRPIAVFDSGVGGLTVLHELLVSLPHEDFVYLGDTARFPYGDRSPDELRRFAVEIADVLLEENAKLLVVACNAATSNALPAVAEHVAARADGIDVIGVVSPESQLAVEATHNGRIGLLATPATVASGAYDRAVAAVDDHVELVSVPCPDLAPIIQSGFPFDERVVETVRSYVAPLREARVDTVILGCTHYPLIRPMLQRMLGRDVTLVTAGAAAARRVEHALAVAEMESPNQGEGDYRFMCTADVESFRALGTRFLQMPLGEIVHVELPAGVPT
jgi:glutamate racemase